VIHAFADCELDEERFQLRRAGRVVEIEPKVFDVLLHLLRAGDRVVSKRELLAALWPGEAVSESVLPRAIAAARRAIGDDRARRRLIETVHRRGYRFSAPVASPASSAPTTEPAPGPQRPFVGREDAMQRLRVALAEARGALTRVALLVGEPGIGKTRTLEELVHEASRAGVEVLIGRCYEGEGAPAYWPFVQVLRAACAELPPGALEGELGPAASDLAALLPELRQGRADPRRAATGESGQERFRLFDSVARFLARRARRASLVVALDDLHWADADSLVLFEFLATTLRDVPLLLLGTYRDVAVRRAHPLGSLLGALAREPRCERIALRGLPLEATSELIAGLAGAAPAPELCASLHDMTEGNPFFVHELVRLLAERGRLAAVDPRELALALPQSVRDAIGRRLDALSPACNELLRTGAAIGREFHTGLLEQVTGCSGAALLEPLGEAVAAGVLLESVQGIGRYLFGHALVRQTLYEELSVPQRAVLHRRIGEALESGAAGAPEARAAELAHHFFEAAPGGDVARAVSWCVRAAQRAYAGFAYDESARHYERALQAQELSLPVDEARRGEILLALGEAWWAAGERERFRECFAQVAEIGRRLGRADLLAQAAVGMRAHGEMGIVPDAQTLDVLEEALAATRAGYPALRARVLARMAASAPYARSMAQREALAREAFELAEASGERLAISDALAARYWATLGPDRVEERLEVGREANLLGERWGDPRLRILGLEACIGAHLVQGDMPAARAGIETYEALARELRQPLFLFLASVLRGSEAMNCGRFDEAERHFSEALTRGRRAVHYAQILHDGVLYWLHSMRGDFVRFADVEAMLSQPEVMELAGSGALARSGVAHGRIALGDTESARELLDAVAQKGFASIERDEHWLLTMGSLTDVVTQLGDRERAAELYELLAPYAHLFVCHDLLRAVAGSVEDCLGDLAATLGRYDEGIARFERALARERQAGLAPAVCNSLAGLARLHHLRGAPGDRRRAESLLGEAEAGARAIGCQRDFRALLDCPLPSKGS
jgi:DNA-binding winged helix-turn-helix (wHTH) protein/tetratricopeptide (TPR) repeat protein